MLKENKARWVIRIVFNLIFKLISQVENWFRRRLGLRINWKTNTPSEIADAMRYFIEGKKVCDVGASRGYFMKDIAKYAKEVVGIEINKKECEICQEKGLNVIQGNALTDKIPDADVYYIYFGFDKRKQVLERIRKLKGEGKLTIMQVRPDQPDERDNWNMAISAERRRLYFKITR